VARANSSSAKFGTGKLNFCALSKEQETLVDSHLVPKVLPPGSNQSNHSREENGKRETYVVLFRDKPTARQRLDHSWLRLTGKLNISPSTQAHH
jgi:hypothetical protein